MPESFEKNPIIGGEGKKEIERKEWEMDQTIRDAIGTFKDNGDLFLGFLIRALAIEEKEGLQPTNVIIKAIALYLRENKYKELKFGELRLRVKKFDEVIKENNEKKPKNRFKKNKLEEDIFAALGAKYIELSNRIPRQAINKPRTIGLESRSRFDYKSLAAGEGRERGNNNNEH